MDDRRLVQPTSCTDHLGVSIYSGTFCSTDSGQSMDFPKETLPKQRIHSLFPPVLDFEWKMLTKSKTGAESSA